MSSTEPSLAGNREQMHRLSHCSCHTQILNLHSALPDRGWRLEQGSGLSVHTLRIGCRCHSFFWYWCLDDLWRRESKRSVALLQVPLVEVKPSSWLSALCPPPPSKIERASSKPSKAPVREEKRGFRPRVPGASKVSGVCGHQNHCSLKQNSPGARNGCNPETP